MVKKLAWPRGDVERAFEGDGEPQGTLKTGSICKRLEKAGLSAYNVGVLDPTVFKGDKRPLKKETLQELLIQLEDRYRKAMRIGLMNLRRWVKPLKRVLEGDFVEVGLKRDLQEKVRWCIDCCSSDLSQRRPLSEFTGWNKSVVMELDDRGVAFEAENEFSKIVQELELSGPYSSTDYLCGKFRNGVHKLLPKHSGGNKSNSARLLRGKEMWGSGSSSASGAESAGGWNRFGGVGGMQSKSGFTAASSSSFALDSSLAESGLLDAEQRANGRDRGLKTITENQMPSSSSSSSGAGHPVQASSSSEGNVPVRGCMDQVAEEMNIDLSEVLSKKQITDWVSGICREDGAIRREDDNAIFLLDKKNPNSGMVVRRGAEPLVKKTIKKKLEKFIQKNDKKRREV